MSEFMPQRRRTDGAFGTLTRLWDFIDNRGVIRRIVLAVAVWMTWRASLWAMAYADGSNESGAEIAMIVGAVTLPITTFCGYVFKAYLESGEKKQ